MSEKLTSAKANDLVRREQTESLLKHFEEKGEYVRRIKSNEIGFYGINCNGEDIVIKISVSVPKGDRSGEPFDLDVEADSYEKSEAEKAIKEKEKAEAKQKKIERDKKQREKIKAQREKAEKEKAEKESGAE